MSEGLMKRKLRKENATKKLLANKVKVCAYCGKKFEIHVVQQITKKYCSDRCRDFIHREKVKD